MDRFVIQGGRALQGAVNINGAKNAALPALAASLLTEEEVVLEGVPELRDVDSMILLLLHLGVTVRRKGNTVFLRATSLASHEAPYDLVRKMRASIVVLGPLLSRFHDTRVSLPGGCAIGARPVNLHIGAMERLGAKTSIEKGYINAACPGGLTGNKIYFDKVTVTGTENAMMAAVLARGTTVLENCAEEPEVVDLGELLLKMGARMEGLGTSKIVIEGVPSLHGARHSVVPDRIEAGTYLTAGLITNGDVRINNCVPDHIQSYLDKLEEAGARLETGETHVRCLPGALRGCDVHTAPYPGFATDMQAQWISLMTQAEGSSVVTESIFENRFMHVPELVRMGANISVDGNTAVVKGKTSLTGASVMATDLRASASLVLAALVAEGESTVNRVYHIDRGYSHIVANLKNLGADIERIRD